MMTRRHSCLFAGMLLAVSAAAQPTAVRFEFYTPPDGLSQERMEVLARGLNFASWPAGDGLFVAPPISRSLLAEPSAATREVKACTTVMFSKLPWGKCDWAWNDFEIEMALAPSARAAHEYLLAAMADNELPSEALVPVLAKAERPSGLGSVAFLTRSRSGGDVRIRFTRGNLAVRVIATRAGADPLPLARRIDTLIAGQQPLTPRQLLDRRPKITIARPQRAGMAPFNVVLPSGAEVMQLRAMVDGQPAAARAGGIQVRENTRDIELTAITRDLLAATAELKLER